MRESVILHIQGAIEVTAKQLCSAEADLNQKEKEMEKAIAEVNYQERQLVEMADFLDEYSSSTLRKDENWLNSVLNGDEVKTIELRRRYEALMKDDGPDEIN